MVMSVKDLVSNSCLRPRAIINFVKSEFDISILPERFSVFYHERVHFTSDSADTAGFFKPLMEIDKAYQ